MKRQMIWAVAGTAGLALAAVPFVASAGEVPASRLQAVTPGGLFLANIDDDAHRCQAPARRIAADAVDREAANDERFYAAKEKLSQLPDRAEADKQYLALRRAHRWEQNLADRQLAACNDAADTVVNGAADEQDLFRLAVTARPDTPAGATATLTATGQVRLFVKHARWQVAGRLTTTDLRRGVEVGLEGTDVVRDPARWDGTSVVTLTVSADGKSTACRVRLREAPVLTQVNTQRLEKVFTNKADDDNGKAWRATVAGIAPLTTLDSGSDDWTQDLFEPAYQKMNGHGMRVLIPSVNDMHRQAARVVYTQLRGPDVAAVHIPGVPVAATDDENTYDSMGNLETMPDGTVVVGTRPSAEIVKFFRAQGTRVVTVDTSWLSIGHVDEFIQFLPVGSGWKAMVADPQAGLDLLSTVPQDEKLHGDLPKLEWPYDERIDQRTVAEFRADPQFVDTNRIAARKISANLTKLGLSPDRIVRVPVLFTARGLDWAVAKSAIDAMADGPDKDKAIVALNARRSGVAETPNFINGLVLSGSAYVAPKPYGPLLNGHDVFADAATRTLAKLGVGVTYVDDLTSAHVSEGEIHCSTNVYRAQ